MPGAHPSVARATHLLGLRRPDEALRVLGPAIAEDPDSSALLCAAAHAHLLRSDVVEKSLAAGECEAALSLSGRAAAADPGAEWPHRLMSIAQAELGHLQDAATSAFRAVQLEPFLYAPHLQYAWALSQLPGAEAREQAWQEGRRAVELAPNEPQVHLLMAQLAHPTSGASRAGLQVAEAALRLTLTLDPVNSAALNDLARVQLRRRRGVRAIAGFTEAIVADPRNTAALRNVAIVLTTLLRRAHWIIVVATYAALIGGIDPASGQLVRAGAATIVVGTTAIVVIRLHRAVPGRVLVVLRQLPVLSRWAAAWASFLALATVSLVVSATLPGEDGFLSLAVAVAAVHLGAVCNWVWIARSRR